MASFDIKINITGLTSFLSAQQSGNSPAIAKTLKQWAVRYRTYLQQRFIRNAAGGGVWPALSPITIARRRKGKRKSNNVQILRDTGTLLQALDPIFSGAAGAIEDSVPQNFFIVVGYGGASMHPSGLATVADIAKFHNFGMGHNPKRTIMVMPDSATMQEMSNDAQRNLQQEAKDAIG